VNVKFAVSIPSLVVNTSMPLINVRLLPLETLTHSPTLEYSKLLFIVPLVVKVYCDSVRANFFLNYIRPFFTKNGSPNDADRSGFILSPSKVSANKKENGGGVRT
jgi:hypothetical protein